MKVIFFQRKPSKYNYSIEILFDSIRKQLPDSIKAIIVISRFENSGIFRKLYNILEVPLKEKGDINHVTGDVHYLTFLMQKKKTILTIHDINLLYSNSKIKRFIHSWFWLKVPILCSSVVTVISQTTKSEVLKYSDCSPEKIKVIHNCISSKFNPFPKSFNKEKPVLLQIGTKANKNIKRLTKAIEGINCRLEIIGKPPDDVLEELVKSKVDFRWQSNLTEEEVIQKYVECDILVFVSTFEGFGLPIVEANTIERVVVTSNVSSMPEIAGQAACCVNPFEVSSIREGILKVIEDDVYREQLIELGRANRERFSSAAIAQAYADLYQEVYSKYNVS